MTLALDGLIVALCVALAAWVVAARDAWSAVVGFIGYGLLLSLAWVRLASVDIALTEAAIGGGATGLLLLRAVARPPPSAGAMPGRPFRLAAALLGALIAAGLALAVLLLPAAAPTLAPEAARHLPQTELGNPVTAVLVVYRGLDTLLETVVLLIALLGVWSLAPDRSWAGTPPRLVAGDPSGALTLVGRVLPPIGILFGIHLVWAGADEPGGAFQGGTVLAAMWLLATMAGLVPMPATGRRWLRVLLVAGPALFMAAGALGWVTAGSFLGFAPSGAKPLILLIEAGLTLSIAVTLALLVAGAPQRSPTP